MEAGNSFPVSPTLRDAGPERHVTPHALLTLICTSSPLFFFYFLSRLSFTRAPARPFRTVGVVECRRCKTTREREALWSARGETWRGVARRGDSQRCLPYPQAPSFPAPKIRRDITFILVYPRRELDPFTLYAPTRGLARTRDDTKTVGTVHSQRDALDSTRRRGRDDARSRAQERRIANGRTDGRKRDGEERDIYTGHVKAYPRSCVTRFVYTHMSDAVEMIAFSIHTASNSCTFSPSFSPLLSLSLSYRHSELCVRYASSSECTRVQKVQVTRIYH